MVLGLQHPTERDEPRGGGTKGNPAAEAARRREGDTATGRAPKLGRRAKAREREAEEKEKGSSETKRQAKVVVVVVAVAGAWQRT